MKSLSIGYSDGDKHVRTERFLNKTELREMFPEAEYVTLSIITKRKRLHKAHSKEGKAWLRRERMHVKNRVIWL